MEKMVPKERILAAVMRKPVDYVPCAPFMNFQDWPQRVGKRWQYPFGPSLEETLEYMIGVLGVDQVILTSFFLPGATVPEKVWQEGDVLHKSFQTPSGSLHAAVRLTNRWPHGFDIPFFSDYMPAYAVEQWVKRREDVECLRHILLPPRGAKHDLDGIRRHFWMTKRLADEYNVPIVFSFGLGLTGAVQMFGPSEVCLKAADDPDLLDAYLELDHEWNIKNCEVALDMGVDMFQRNGFYESGSFFSPKMLDRFLSRRLSEEIRLVHDAGKPIVYTMHSGITPILNYLSKLEFDGLVCPDVFLKHENGPAMKEKLGKHMSFWTGPSDTIHMPVDNPEEVRKAVRYVFEVFGKTGLLITPCSSSKAVFPWGNVLAMIEEWKTVR